MHTKHHDRGPCVQSCHSHSKMVRALHRHTTRFAESADHDSAEEPRRLPGKSVGRKSLGPVGQRVACSRRFVREPDRRGSHSDFAAMTTCADRLARRDCAWEADPANWQDEPDLPKAEDTDELPSWITAVPETESNYRHSAGRRGKGPTLFVDSHTFSGLHSACVMSGQL